MKSNYSILPKSFVFSKWSRKKYAIFASLGKLIKIGNLSTIYCQKALLKSTITSGTELQFEIPIEKDNSDWIPDINSIQFIFLFILPICLLIYKSILNIMFEKTSFFIASWQYTKSIILLTNYKSPVFAKCINRTFSFIYKNANNYQD